MKKTELNMEISQWKAKDSIYLNELNKKRHEGEARDIDKRKFKINVNSNVAE